MSFRYQPASVVLVRATTDPGDLELPQHVDLSSNTAVERDGRAWLARIWKREDVREALSVASPVLAGRVEQVVQSEPGTYAVRKIRRLVLSVASYLLRWQRRATPFGLFAGVTCATTGRRTTAHVGTGHRVLVRADAEWLTTLIDRIERHPELRLRLLVTTNSAGFVRDGRFIVAGRPVLGDAASPGPVRETSVRYTRPVRAALAAATQPVRFDALADRLRHDFPASAAEKIHCLLSDLVDQDMLITSLRPPMTAADGLTHLISALRAADGHELPDIAALLDHLDEIAERLARHNTHPDQAGAAASRADTSIVMTAVEPGGSGQVLAADVRLEARITLPHAVLDEAASAAEVLVRLGTRPFGTADWRDYHARFRARYGPAALVPVRDLVADSGLGYPAGYPGSARARPSWRMLTERDAELMALIQRATLDGAERIELTEPIIATLTAGLRDDMVAPQRVELGVELHAASAEEIDRGRFELWVTATPGANSSMAGRFAYLLDEPDRARLAATYTSGEEGTVAAQLSFPPRRAHNENVVRVPPLLPDVVALSEHPTARSLGVDDLAVTADAEHLYLVRRSTGRRVIPRVMHALDAYQQTPPLARFLAEVADARCAVYGPFDFGAARALPYTPRIRYRRTVLAPARWTLEASDLNHSRLDAPSGDAAIRAWLHRWRVPDRVLLCEGELRLPLDLAQPLERTLLRTRLHRAGRVELRETGGPDARGWIGRPAQLLIPLTLRTPPTRRPPAVTLSPAPASYPGTGEVLHAHLVGNPARFDEILTGHLPRLVTDLAGEIVNWWAGRYRNTITPDDDQYLTVYLRLTAPDRYGSVATRMGEFARDLATRGLPAQISLVPYQPQTGRYGHNAAMAAAEKVFAADTVAALAQIITAAQAGIPGQALAAASMARLAAAFAPDTHTGCQRLVRLLVQQTGALDRALREQAVALADPTGDYRAVREVPGGAQVAAAWQARDDALAAYHRTLGEQRDPATPVTQWPTQTRKAGRHRGRARETAQATAARADRPTPPDTPAAVGDTEDCEPDQPAQARLLARAVDGERRHRREAAVPQRPTPPARLGDAVRRGSLLLLPTSNDDRPGTTDTAGAQGR